MIDLLPADRAMHAAFATLAAARGAVPPEARDEEMHLLPADDAWPAQFAAEAARLRRALQGALAVEIEHVGSTAVPDLDAIPVVDILVGLSGPARAEEVVVALQTLGYQSLGYQSLGYPGPGEGDGTPGRWPMRYRGSGPHFDAALVARDGALWAAALRARENLRANPALARHYAAAKWAAHYQGSTMLLGYRHRMRAAVRAVDAGTVPPDPAPSFEPVHLVTPDHAHLRAFEAAVAEGWSPSSTRDTTAEVLGAIRTDPGRFLAELNGEVEGMVALLDGTTVPRLPGRVFWIWDSTFCGAINLRHVPGTEDLPPYVSGHVGYGVVPDKRNRGYATEALRLVLPVARSVGLARVLLTCDPGNAASRRVIERNGGVLRGEGVLHGEPKLEFWVPTPA